jgi:hypothetical protein
LHLNLLFKFDFDFALEILPIVICGVDAVLVDIVPGLVFVEKYEIIIAFKLKAMQRLPIFILVYDFYAQLVLFHDFKRNLKLNLR